VSVFSEQVTQHFTLEEVRRSGTEVQTLVLVGGEVGGGVRRRELNHTSTDNLVDELE
jgi:hypothetical protein